MSTCNLVHENLFAYSEGKLPDDTRNLFDKHIAECPQCAGILMEFRLLMNVIEDQKNIEVRPFAEIRMLRGIESKLETRQAKKALPFQRILQPAIISAGLAAAVAIGLFIGYEGVNIRQEQNRQKIESVRTDLNIPEMTYEESFTFTE